MALIISNKTIRNVESYRRPRMMKEKVVSIGHAYGDHKIIAPDGERAPIVNLQSLYACSIFKNEGRRKRTVKVRPATPDNKRALAMRKMFFMIYRLQRGGF